jgi:hypothetical protein
MNEWRVQTEICYQDLFNYRKGLEHDIAIFSSSLYLFIDKQMWKNFFHVVLRRYCSHDSLRGFIEADIPEGLGSSIEWIHAQLLGPSQIHEDSRKAFDAFMKQMELEGVNCDGLCKEAQRKLVDDIVDGVGSQAEAGRTLGVSQSHVSRMTLSHKPDQSRQFGWMPKDPEKAADKILQTFGSDFSERLVREMGQKLEAVK